MGLRQFEPRHELKYYINAVEVEPLARRLSAAMRLDPNAGQDREYAVRSLYFDDAYNIAYYDKIHGVMDRDKYRLRIYKHSDREILLERKRKMGNFIHKTSVPITRRLAAQIIDGNPSGLFRAENPLLQDLYRVMRTGLLRPAVIVDYDREAYYYPVEHVRVTFDKRLKTGLHSTELFNPEIMTVSPMDEERVILEVKYDRYLPDHIAALLAGTSAERSAISKYTLCRRFEPL